MQIRAVLLCALNHRKFSFLFIIRCKDKKNIPYLNISAKRGTNLYLPLINVTLVYRLYHLKKSNNVRQSYLLESSVFDDLMAQIFANTIKLHR